MDAVIAAVPLLPGAATELQKLAEDLSGSRFEEHKLSRRALGINRECWWTREEDGIGFVLLEGPGAQNVATAFAMPATPHEAWYRSKLAAAVPSDMDWRHAFSAELVYRSPEHAEPLGQSTVLAFPLEPGRSSSWKALGAEAVGEHKEAFEDFRNRMGLHQTWWLMHEPEGDIALMHMESDDVVGAFCTLADSQNVIDLWLRQKFLEIHGVDWQVGIPGRMSKLALDWVDEPSPRRVIRLDAEAAMSERRRR